MARFILAAFCILLQTVNNTYLYRERGSSLIIIVVERSATIIL